jgi:hypothetical protein
MMRGEIMHEAIRGLMEPERRLERFDGAIALGLADTKAGRVQEIEAVRRELRDAAAESPLTA